MSDTQNEPLPGEKAIKVKKAGPILSGADRYDIFEKGQKVIREFVEELFRFLIDFPGMMYLVFILTIICQDALTFRVGGQGDRLRNLNYLLQSKKQAASPVGDTPLIPGLSVHY